MTIFAARNIQGPTEAKGGYREILKTSSTHALENMLSIVLDASTVSPDSDGRRLLKAGTILTKNANNQYERYTGTTSAANEVQSVVATGATAGTFTITLPEGETFREETTAAIPYNATASAVQTALRALDQLDTADVAVTGGPLPTTAVTVTFGGAYANENVPALVVNNTNLTGGTAVVSTTTQGQVAKVIKGILGIDVEFLDGSAGSDTPAPMIQRDATFRADRIIDFGTYASALRTALPTCLFQ